MGKTLISVVILAVILTFGLTVQASVNQTTEADTKPVNIFTLQDTTAASLVLAGGGRDRGDGDGGGGRGQGGQGEIGYPGNVHPDYIRSQLQPYSVHPRPQAHGPGQDCRATPG